MCSVELDSEQGGARTKMLWGPCEDAVVLGTTILPILHGWQHLASSSCRVKAGWAVPQAMEASPAPTSGARALLLDGRPASPMAALCASSSCRGQARPCENGNIRHWARQTLGLAPPSSPPAQSGLLQWCQLGHGCWDEPGQVATLLQWLSWLLFQT